jgi:hypothetical protein
MRKPEKNIKKGHEVNQSDKKLIPDDTIRPLNENDNEQPEIFGISKRVKSLNRKGFIKSAASVTGLAALGTLLKSCEESDLDIIKKGDNCTCHAVCTCNSEVKDGNKYDKGNDFGSTYDVNYHCTCDTVCTCNSVCTCDAVCTCDSEGGGSGGSYYYTYWYPN